MRDFPVGHQLRLPTPNAGGIGMGSVLGQGTKIPQAKIVTKYIHPPVLKHFNDPHWTWNKF